MSEKKSPNDNITNAKKNDYVVNKLLLVFTVAFALILFLMNIGRMMKSNTTYIGALTATRVLAGLAAAGVVLGIVLSIVEHVRGKDTRCKLIKGKNIAVISAFIAVVAGALAFVYNPTMLFVLYVFVPAVVVLYIIYYSYPREFFMIALAAALGGIGIWLVAYGIINASRTVFLGIVAAIVLLLAVFTAAAHIGKGKFKLFGHEYTPFKSDARYGIVYLSFVLVLAVVAAALIIADMANYFVFGLLGYIIIAAIYYTIKLI
mgnify:CR=1 FL=1